MIKGRVDEILQEQDATRQLALSRQLRAKIWAALSEDDRAKLRGAGVDVDMLRARLRLVDHGTAPS
ncbi:hypothetical protein [Marimonas lutisalis]|uniref:hypothetical protein n=1 Tax=Marimonas lutisalis TaxID=2545756 RepID=UPI0010F813AD|nr:hypothetical protein [Marimonas lutisalis]